MVAHARACEVQSLKLKFNYKRGRGPLRVCAIAQLHVHCTRAFRFIGKKVVVWSPSHPFSCVFSTGRLVKGGYSSNDAWQKNPSPEANIQIASHVS
jgi:hypothetical protein